MYVKRLLGPQVGIALSLMVLASESSAQTYDPALESVIRKAIPQPARCAITSEPLFYCRFDNALEGNIVLELSSTKEGPSASLTYNYGDSKGAELFGVVSDFFGSVGVDKKSFASCVQQSHVVSGEMDVGDLILICRYADLGDRVTYEIFAHRTPESLPRASDVAVMRRSKD